METDTEIDRMLADLHEPSAYPEHTTSIKLIQTHISWVFICDEFVYKLKKPVNFGFLDFSSRDKRKYYCDQEVELNKRLAKDVYIGVFPVIQEEGRYKITGSTTHTDNDKIVEYAVKMRFIPDEILLKNKFKSNTLTDDDIRKTAKAIADFHQTAMHSPMLDKFGSLETVKFNTDENFEQTEEFIGSSISTEQFDALKNWTNNFYDNSVEVFQRRIDEKKIRDCHGDLHMEHICLTDPITIIDCIEFNERFRYSDTASDIAFLLMDLEYHGGKQAAELIYDSYKSYSGESGADFDLVLKYYKIYRAYVRGKVTSFRLNDPNISEDNKNEAISTAQKYFKLAFDYIND